MLEDTAAGSNLYPAGAGSPGAYQNSVRSGTWRCLGYCPPDDEEGNYYSTLFIRIS